VTGTTGSNRATVFDLRTPAETSAKKKAASGITQMRSQRRAIVAEPSFRADAIKLLPRRHDRLYLPSLVFVIHLAQDAGDGWVLH
jgi:hypothetical protein